MPLTYYVAGDCVSGSVRASVLNFFFFFFFFFFLSALLLQQVQIAY